MNEQSNKEYVSIEVSPKIKKQIEFYKDNEKMQLEVIKSFFEDEKVLMKDELKSLEEHSVKYRALILKSLEGYRDCYSSVEDEYNKVAKLSDQLLKKVEILCNPIENKVNNIKDIIKNVNKSLETIDIYKLETTLTILDKVNNLNDKETEILKLVLNNKSK